MIWPQSFQHLANSPIVEANLGYLLSAMIIVGSHVSEVATLRFAIGPAVLRAPDLEIAAEIADQVTVMSAIPLSQKGRPR